MYHQFNAGPVIQSDGPLVSSQGRASKRPRNEAMVSHSDLALQSDEATDASVLSRTRGPSACEKCRTRKTKCDNRRPSCGYCSKHELQCIYDNDFPSSTCCTNSGQVLDAIAALTSLVQQQQHRPHCACCSHSGQDETSRARRLTDSSASCTGLQQLPNHAARSSVEASFNEGSETSAQPPLRPQGMESILQWKILHNVVTSTGLFVDDETLVIPFHAVPSTEYQEMTRLESKYIIGIHLKNPILDLTELHRLISHVSENGLDWSTKSCLVALVCAIGAITQQYPYETPSPGYNTTPDRLHYSLSSGSEPELSMQYWGLAAKRLGFAVGQNDLEAVQCLCLAGIWYMHHMLPLQAWSYFNLAGSTWYSVYLKDQSSHELIPDDGHANSLTLKQSLYFTIWKSDELRLELDLPGSVLENVNPTQTFPLPPNLDAQSPNWGPGETERGWYYYLAEIAARHLLNRLVRAHSWTTEEPSRKEIGQMIAQAEIFETQIHAWHSSLPSVLKFEIPSGPSIRPHPDDDCQILRHRYLTCRELIYRPFARLCVENRLDFDPNIRTKVVSFASQSLQYCMYKLSQTSPYLHQGAWFTLRSAATTSLILIAAHTARSDPTLLGAQELVLPEGWRESIARAVEMIRPLWNDKRGGASETRRVIQSALANSV